MWEYTIAIDGGAGGFKAAAKTPFVGVVVSMDPVDGENLAGDSDSYTSGTDNKDTKNFNEAVHFDWKQKEAGEYKLAVSGGWVEKVGAPGEAVAFGSELSPLGADLQIDVSPTTGYVYGIVTDSKGFRVEGATVTANGASATTDAFGRYRIRGFSGATVNKVKNQVAITVDKAGYTQGKATIAFAANAPHQEDITLGGVAETATVSGTVRSGGDPVAGVTIMVNDTFPLGRTSALKTGDDGTYTATVPVGDVVIAPSKAGMSFFPESHEVKTTDGSAISGLDFTGYAHGTITGRVLNTDGGPMSGVKVTATPAEGGEIADSSRTDVRGVYSLSVPFGRYMVAAETDGTHTFATEDGDASVTVNVASGATESVEDFEATMIPRTPSSDATLSDLSLSAGTLDPAFADSTMMYTAMVTNDVASVTVMATTGHDSASVAITSSADTMGTDESNGRSVDLGVGETTITVTVTSEDENETMAYTVTVTRAHAVVTLSAPATVDEGGSATITASVDHAQADTFMVTVTAAGDGFDSLSTNADLTFAPGETTSTGTVTVTAANDTIRNAMAQTVTVKGSTTNTDVMEIDSLVIAVTDDEMVASAPRNLEVTPGDALGAVNLTWDRPIQIGSWPITGYEAEATAPQRAMVAGEVDNTTDPANPTAAFTGLALGVEYTFTVHATTDGGDGDMASTTGKAMPAVDLTFTGSSLSENGSDSVRVQASLTGVSSEDVTVTVTVSDANLARVYNADLVIPAGVQSVNTDTAFVVAIDNPVDAPDTTVTISATADNATVPDTEEQATTITDDDTVPGAPGTLVFSSVSTTGFTVEWTSPSAPGTSDITHYQIRYSSDALDDDDAWTTVTGSGGARTHAITGLTAGTTYNVEVRAVSAAGDGTAQSGSQATSS
ncbi:MAG: fibronectin type III domain-containing protein [Gemmatimonadota bacterium]|nr:fibronectin type III domain-containing protein [Gemmatimonadota bacterium]